MQTWLLSILLWVWPGAVTILRAREAGLGQESRRNPTVGYEEQTAQVCVPEIFSGQNANTAFRKVPQLEAYLVSSLKLWASFLQYSQPKREPSCCQLVFTDVEFIAQAPK